jgi:hypothetical protein
MLIRVAVTAIARDGRVAHRVTAAGPAAALDSALEAGA